MHKYFLKIQEKVIQKKKKYKETYTIKLPKIRTHRVLINYNPTIQLQKVNDGTYDSYTVTQEYTNEQGIFLDSNIEVSSIVKNNISDLYTTKKIVSDYDYSPNEEIKNYELLDIDKTTTISLRNEIDSNNRINVYQRYVEDIKKTHISNYQDDFVLLELNGFYSLKYKMYFKKGEKYGLDYYFDDNEKMTRENLNIEIFEYEVIEMVEQEGEKEYLYQIDKI